MIRFNVHFHSYIIIKLLTKPSASGPSVNLPLPTPSMSNAARSLHTLPAIPRLQPAIGGCYHYNAISFGLLPPTHTLRYIALSAIVRSAGFITCMVGRFQIEHCCGPMLYVLSMAMSPDLPGIMAYQNPVFETIILFYLFLKNYGMETLRCFPVSRRKAVCRYSCCIFFFSSRSLKTGYLLIRKRLVKCRVS